MSKFNSRVSLGFALALASGALVLAVPANAQSGAYTDPSSNVRASLQREHLVLGHTDAVRQPSAVNRRAVSSQVAKSSYASDAPVYVYPIGKDLSILSQR